MLHWIALLPGSPAPGHEAKASDQQGSEHVDDTAQPAAIPLVLSTLHLSWWALQFTPRVASLENAVVLEVKASERLFGGAAALRERIVNEAQAHGVVACAHASTALAAVALARHAATCASGHTHEASELAARLNKLPLDVLPGVATHAPTLARLGCRDLADVRALPRGGLSRRFGAGLLHTLDQAYGHSPEALEWLSLPAVFDARLELSGRVESAPALLFAASHLLQQLCAWLAGRQAGVMAFTLRWLHDWHRRDSSREGEWTVRLGSPTRDYARLSRLLAEHLQRIQLSAPVGDISLHADEIEALPLSNLQLFQEHREDQLSANPDALLTPAAQRAQRDALLALLEKLSVRLGPERVLQARVQADHRLECAQQWRPAVSALSTPSHHHPQAHAARTARAVTITDMPQPCWVLHEPMPLALDQALGQHPIYQGKLTLLAGPHRIEAGWWDPGTEHTRVTRDYYLASSAHAGLLWIYKRQQAADDTRSPWYLHGFFA
jgi:protein ImuB